MGRRILDNKVYTVCGRVQEGIGFHVCADLTFDFRGERRAVIWVVRPSRDVKR